MSTPVSLQFRPTIIIFVGATGETIQGQDTGTSRGSSKTVYEHFCNLCIGLDEVLYQGVGLIAVGEGAMRAKPLPIKELPPDMQAEEDEFPRLLAAVMHRIQSERCRQCIEDAGYPVMHPQIYIVGQTTSAWISQVAEWVSTELSKDRLSTLVYYVLIDFPRYRGTNSKIPQQSSAPVWPADLCSQKGAMPRVNFCYMYEELGQRQTFLEEADIRYAVAESLFGFVATGLTSSPTFIEATQISSGITDIDSRIGSLGTSMIKFPRTTVEAYCTYEHSIEITDYWISTIQLGGQSRKQQEELRTQAHENAYRDAQRIRDDLADQQDWPDEDGHFLSSLALFQDGDRVGQLEAASERIFQYYIYEDIADNVNEQVGWSVITRRREPQAAVALRAWQNIAETIWVEAGQILQQRIGRTVDELWFLDTSGIVLAKAYVDHLDDALKRVRDRFSEWRQDHRDNYDHELGLLQERSRGSWIVPPRASNILGDRGEGVGPKAKPTAGSALSNPTDSAMQTDMPLTFDAHTGLGGMSLPNTSAAPPQQPESSSRLPEREQTIVRNLGARIDWMRSQVPSIGSLMAIGIMAVPPLVLLTLTLPPLSRLAAPLAALFSFIGWAALTVAISWLFRKKSQQRLYAAEQDLLRAYCLYYAYRCKWWEDQLRVVILSPLIGKVRRMRVRLEDMQGFIGRIANELRQSAALSEAELFDSPSGLRDVFVGHGELLSRRGYGYGLANFNREVRRRRHLNPAEAWHRTPDQINAHLREFLAQSNGSIIDLDEIQLEEHIRAFCHKMVVSYLKDGLVDIGAALSAEANRGKQVWQKALGNSTVLYRPYNNALELIYINGRDEHRATVPAPAIPTSATMICTTHREWLLVARFWTGGAGTHWSDRSFESVPLGLRLPTKPTW
jgi:hypothetical protein